MLEMHIPLRRSRGLQLGATYICRCVYIYIYADKECLGCESPGSDLNGLSSCLDGLQPVLKLRCRIWNGLIEADLMLKFYLSCISCFGVFARIPIMKSKRCHIGRSR